DTPAATGRTRRGEPAATVADFIHRKRLMIDAGEGYIAALINGTRQIMSDNHHRFRDRRWKLHNTRAVTGTFMREEQTAADFVDPSCIVSGLRCGTSADTNPARQSQSALAMCRSEIAKCREGYCRS